MLAKKKIETTISPLSPHEPFLLQPLGQYALTVARIIASTSRIFIVSFVRQRLEQQSRRRLSIRRKTNSNKNARSLPKKKGVKIIENVHVYKANEGS